ncbi:hypothetical protein OIU83_01810 [Flavobacterium sp. LS1R49]|uniref:Uncharacterized protein n=1 Tax=Flavobacterium shii TaxID=2987687 RepID=A0A9X2Z8Z2_9FLAO|nr:hypothetical protein [Flavobacterium shii]MCV9926371.1 hypothetical protein [Flavobacterium shii]
MAIQTLNTIKNWFKTGLKPTQTQFWDTWDSFRHKYEKVPAKDVDGLDELLLSKAEKIILDEHLADKKAHAPQINTDWNSESGFSKLLNKPVFKTINGEEILGNGDITIIEGGAQTFDETLANGNTSNKEIIFESNGGDTTTFNNMGVLLRGNNGSNSSLSGLGFTTVGTDGFVEIENKGQIRVSHFGGSTLQLQNNEIRHTTIDGNSSFLQFDNSEKGHFTQTIQPKTGTIALLSDIPDGASNLQQVLEQGASAIDYDIEIDNGNFICNSTTYNKFVNINGDQGAITLGQLSPFLGAKISSDLVTASYTVQLPNLPLNTDPTLPVSVNGNVADSNGNITIPFGETQGLQSVLQNGSIGIIPDLVLMGHTATDNSTYSTINFRAGGESSTGIGMFSNGVLDIGVMRFNLNSQNGGGFITSGMASQNVPFRIGSQSTGIIIGGGTGGIILEGQGGGISMNSNFVKINSKNIVRSINGIEADNDGILILPAGSSQNLELTLINGGEAFLTVGNNETDIIMTADNTASTIVLSSSDGTNTGTLTIENGKFSLRNKEEGFEQNYLKFKPSANLSGIVNILIPAPSISGDYELALKDKQITVLGSTTIKDSWNGQTILFTGSGTITVPENLPEEFSFNAITMPTVTIDWTITSPFVWMFGTPSITPEKTYFNFTRVGNTNQIILSV